VNLQGVGRNVEKMEIKKVKCEVGGIKGKKSV
jgi:hypothetical protein